MGKIYTKTGDKGQTSLLSGKRVPKSHIRIEAYGTVDELNSIIGLLRAQTLSTIKNAYDDTCDIESLKQFEVTLKTVQHDLFTVGCLLASDDATQSETLPKLNLTHIKQFEEEIDAWSTRLSPLTHFILPCGSELSAQVHVARTVSRRAERHVVQLSEHETVDETLITYLNRLSDFLFVAARMVNSAVHGSEEKWKK